MRSRSAKIAPIVLATTIAWFTPPTASTQQPRPADIIVTNVKVHTVD